MFSLKQLRTLCGSLDMCLVDTGVAKVVSLDVYRHNGDHRDGRMDSWFVNATCHLVGVGGKVVNETFTLKSQLDHGSPAKACNRLATQITTAGEINLHLWKSDTPR
jgi:hypothetical protein